MPLVEGAAGRTTGATNNDRSSSIISSNTSNSNSSSSSGSSLRIPRSLVRLRHTSLVEGRGAAPPQPDAVDAERRDVGSRRVLVASRLGETYADNISPMILLTDEERAMFAAVKGGNVTRLEEILENPAVDVNAVDEIHLLPLHWTAVHNEGAMAAVLLQHRADVDGRTTTDWTSLHIAAKHKADAVAEVLLQHRAEVNARTANMGKRTPLHFAAKNNADTVASLLVQHGAEVDAKTEENETPSFFAAEVGACGISRLLLAAGADVNIGKAGLTPFAVAASWGWIPSAYTLANKTNKQGLCSGLREAIQRDRAFFLQQMFSKMPDLRDCGSQDSERLLVVAAYAAAPGSLLVIADHGASMMGKDTNLAILAAARSGYHDFLDQALFSQNPCRVLDEENRTPAHVLVNFAPVGSTKYKEALNTILFWEAVRPENGYTHCIQRAQDGSTPVFSAVQRNNIEVVVTLLEHGERLNFTDEGGRIPLFNALRSDSLDTILQLVELQPRYYFNIDHIAKDGSTPLLNATVNGVSPVVFKLLAVGVDANIADKAGCLALHRALDQNDAEVSQELAMLLATPTDKVSARCMQMHGKTPLHLSALKGNRKVCELQLDHCRRQQRRCLDVEDEMGKTPLWDAVAGDHIDIVSLLFDAGAQVQVTAKDNSTLLHFALAKSSTTKLSENRMAKFLLARGAHLEAAEHENNAMSKKDLKMVMDPARSRLHWAAFACDAAAATLALEALGRSIVSRVDEDGDTALGIARQQHCCDDLLEYMQGQVDAEYSESRRAGLAVVIAAAGSLCRLFGKVQAVYLEGPTHMTTVYATLGVAFLGAVQALLQALLFNELEWASEVVACIIPLLIGFVIWIATPGSAAAEAIVDARVAGKRMWKRTWSCAECAVWLLAAAVMLWVRQDEITVCVCTLLVISSVLKAEPRLPWKLSCESTTEQAGSPELGSGDATAAATGAAASPAAAAVGPTSTAAVGGSSTLPLEHVSVVVSLSQGPPAPGARGAGQGSLGHRAVRGRAAVLRAQVLLKLATCGLPLWVSLRVVTACIIWVHSLILWRRHFDQRTNVVDDNFTWYSVVAGACASDFIYTVLEGASVEGGPGLLGLVPWLEMTVLQKEEPKFGAVLVLGKSVTAALGIQAALGIKPEDLQDYGRGLELMEQEILATGNVDDKENFDYIAKGMGLRQEDLPRAVKESMRTGTYHGGVLNPGDFDTGNGGKVLADWMNVEQVKIASLTEAEFVALRLYTSSTYRSFNTPIRNGVKPHPLKMTMLYLFEGIKKMRAVRASGDVFMKRITLWRGIRDMTMDLEAFKADGGTELAPMSTTNDRAVAMSYSKSKVPLVFKYDVEGLSVGVNIRFLSLYPKEEEFLYPPLTHLKYVNDYRDGGMHIVEIQPIMP